MQNTEFRIGVIKPVECVKEGWELIKGEYWLLFAITLVGVLIGGFTMYILFGAMFCGIFYCYLRKIDGRPIAFEDLWKGFEWFAPGLLVTLFIVVPIIILYVIIYTIIFSVILFFAAKLLLIQPTTIHDSKIYPYVSPWGPTVIDNFGKIIPIFKDMFVQLQDFFGNMAKKAS